MHRPAQEAKHLPGVARIALGAHAVLIIAPVVAAAEDANAFLDRPLRQLQATPVRGQRFCGRGAVAQAVVECAMPSASSALILSRPWSTSSRSCWPMMLRRLVRASW